MDDGGGDTTKSEKKVTLVMEAEMLLEKNRRALDQEGDTELTCRSH